MNPHYRHFLFLGTLGIGLMSPGGLPGQTAADAEVVSVSHQPPNEGFFLFSPTVVLPVEFSGVIEATDGAHIFDADGDFITAFPIRNPAHAPLPPLDLTVLDGPQAGTSILILSFTQNRLIADRDVSSFGLAGASYELRRAWTLDDFERMELFPLGSGTSSTADRLWIWDDQAERYRRIYHSMGGIMGVGWREVGIGNSDRRFFPLRPGQAISLQLMPWNSSHPITFTGVAPTTPLRIPLRPGFNPVSRGTVEPLTLGQSRLEEYLFNGDYPRDFIWIQEANGNYSAYYFNVGGINGVGWRRVGNGPADVAQTPLSSGFFIELRRPATAFVFLPPLPR